MTEFRVHSGPNEKLRLDFRTAQSMCGPMEGQTKRYPLSVQLLVFAGSLMEDECGEFIAAVPDDNAKLALRIGRLGQVGVDLAALAAAADVLRRLENNPPD